MIKGGLSYLARASKEGGYSNKDLGINMLIGAGTAGLGAGLSPNGKVNQQVGYGYTTTTFNVGLGAKTSPVPQYSMMPSTYSQYMDATYGSGSYGSYGNTNWEHNGSGIETTNYGIMATGVVLSGLSNQFGQAFNSFGTMQQTSNLYNWGLNYSNELKMAANASRFVSRLSTAFYYTGMVMSAKDIFQTHDFEGKMRAGFDTGMAAFGRVPIIGPPVAIYWGTIGKHLHWQWHDRVLTPHMEMLMNSKSGVDFGVKAIMPFP